MSIKNIQKYLHTFFFQDIYLSIVLLYVIARTIFFISSADIAHSPDYGYHLGSAEYYKEHVLSIFSFDRVFIADQNIPNTRANTILFTVHPFLYSYTMGLTWNVLDIAFDEEASYKVLLLIQSIFGILFIYFTYKTAQLVTSNRYIHILTLILVANIPMFSFLMSYLTYDNLTNFLAVLSVYFLILYIKTKQIPYLLYLAISLCLGFLTKITFWPLVVIIGIILIYFLRKNIRSNLQEGIQYIRDKKNIFTTGVFFFCLFAVAVFVLRNIAFYHTPLPGREDLVRGLSQSEIMNKGEVSAEVQQLAQSEKESDKSSLLAREERIDPFSYYKVWQLNMATGIFSIISHKSIMKEQAHTEIYLYLCLIGILSFILVYKKTKYDYLLLLVFMLYVGYLFSHLYTSYLGHGIVSKSIQGRYIFPVIGIMMYMISAGVIAFLDMNHNQVYQFIKKNVNEKEKK